MSLSLLVTSYNSLQHLDRFFSWMSLVNNYFEEVIIIDDCSTDNSLDKITKESDRYSNFIIEQRKINSGRPSLPRNQGISLASARRIIFLDIDDLVPVKYVAHLSQCLTEDCYSGVKFAINETGYNPLYDCNFQVSQTLCTSRFANKNLITFSGASLPTDIAKKYNFINEPLEDWQFWLEICSNESNLKFIKYHDVPVYYDQAQSLSPPKRKQISRVIQKIGYWKLPIYLFESAILRIFEYRAYRRFIRSTINISRLQSPGGL